MSYLSRDGRWPLRSILSNSSYLFECSKGFKNEEPAHTNAIKASRLRSRKLRRAPKLTQNSHGTAARATSTDGNNYNSSSSGRPGLGVTPFTALRLFDRPTVTSVSSRSLQVVLNRDRLQSCVTASPAGHFKTACVQP